MVRGRRAVPELRLHPQRERHRRRVRRRARGPSDRRARAQGGGRHSPDRRGPAAVRLRGTLRSAQPGHASAALRRSLSGRSARCPPSFDEADVSDKPSYVASLPRLAEWQKEAITRHNRERLRALRAVDDLVATVVEALDASGRLDDTYIIYTSDNGFHMGQHRLFMGKTTAYEEDIRVPLAIRGPGIRAGAASAADGPEQRPRPDLRRDRRGRRRHASSTAARSSSCSPTRIGRGGGAS